MTGHPSSRPSKVSSEPSAHSAPISPTGARLPWGMTIAVAFGIILLQAASDLVAGRESARIVARLIFLAVELPLLMAGLSMAFSWSVRRRMAAPQALISGVTVATIIGGLFGMLYGILALHVPELRFMRPPTGANL